MLLAQYVNGPLWIGDISGLGKLTPWHSGGCGFVSQLLGRGTRPVRQGNKAYRELVKELEQEDRVRLTGFWNLSQWPTGNCKTRVFGHYSSLLLYPDLARPGQRDHTCFQSQG